MKFDFMFSGSAEWSSLSANEKVKLQNPFFFHSLNFLLHKEEHNFMQTKKKKKLLKFKLAKKPIMGVYYAMGKNP